MAKKAKPILINLVPKDPFFSTPVGKVLRWALSVGRYIVIFTELIVIISFVTRFSLDRQVTDLNESIFQKRVIIESYGSLEHDVRLVQSKIDQYRQVEQQENLAEVFPQLQNATPRGIIYDQLQVSPDSIDIRGSATSQDALTLFANNLQLVPNLGQVSINRITGSTNENESNYFEFDINILRNNSTNKTTK